MDAVSPGLKIPKIRRVSPDGISRVFCDDPLLLKHQQIRNRASSSSCARLGSRVWWWRAAPRRRRAGTKDWTRAAKVSHEVRRMLPKESFLELGDAYLGQRLSPELKFLSVARH